LASLQCDVDVFIGYVCGRRGWLDFFCLVLSDRLLEDFHDPCRPELMHIASYLGLSCPTEEEGVTAKDLRYSYCS
jgi:hypothetical protein